MTDEYDHILRPFRNKIDSLDNKITELLVEREMIIREVSDIKYEKNVPAILQDRVDEVRNRATAQSILAGSNGQYIKEIYTKIIEVSCDLENQIFDEKNNNEKKNL